MKGDKIYYYDCGSFYIFSRAFHKATGLTLPDYIVPVGIYPDEHIYTDFVNLSKEGVLTIKHHFAWDGSSGPTIHTKSTFRPSLAHDGLFELFRLKKLDLKWFPRANDVLREFALEDNMYEWRANLWHSRAIQKCMRFAAKDYKQEKELVAP